MLVAPFAWRSIMVAGSSHLIIRGKWKAAQVAEFEAAAPRAKVLHVRREGAGGKGRVGQVLADVASAVVIGRFETRMVARIAAVEFQPAQGLIRHVDLKTAPAARWPGVVLADIRVVGRFRLGVEIERSHRDRDAPRDLLAKTQLLARLRGEQRSRTKAADDPLVHSTDIIAVKAFAGADVELDSVTGRENDAALSITQR